MKQMMAARSSSLDRLVVPTLSLYRNGSRGWKPAADSAASRRLAERSGCQTASEDRQSSRWPELLRPPAWSRTLNARPVDRTSSGWENPLAQAFQSSNPVFASSTFQNFDYSADRSQVMTVQGTAFKAFALTALTLVAAGWSWSKVIANEMQPGFVIGAGIGGMIVAFITIFKPKIASWTAPVYAVLEGLFLGAISVFFEKAAYQGMAMQAVGLTGGTLFVMLFIYMTGLIKVTEKLTSAIVAATGAIALFYLLTMVLRMFHVEIPYIHSSGPIGIAFSLFVVGLAAFNLLLDFEQIKRGAESGAPKWMEWYSAFGLLVTLVWLYLEILRLLRKISDRR